MGKKSLAEQITELSAPKSDFDIENSEIADPFADSDNDKNNSLKLDDEEAQREHYVSVPKSKLRHENGLVRDKKYAGQVTAREALYEESENSSDGSESESSVLENEACNAVLGRVSDSESAANEDASNNESDDESGSGSASDSDGVSDDVSESEDETRGSTQRKKMKAMMAIERKHLVSRLSQSATADALKGYAILQQHKEFDALIDSRLKVQKALATSNLLPANKQQFSELPGTSGETSAKLDLAVNACYDLLDTIGSLRDALFSREGLATDAMSPESLAEKRTLAQYLARSSKQDDVLLQYRSTVLTKWLAKIQNSSGSSAMNASKFKALNQLAEQQVLNNLSDMDRLVKRTRLNRRKITPLGYKEEKPEADGKDDGEFEENEDTQYQTQTQTRALHMQEMPQIFDDEDFYRVLLNDLVDKKIQSNDPTLGLQFALRGAASTKLKKNVDNKASKGRKLRFHVQEPIANFDTPRQWLKWNDDQIDEFFASLLGQKISMKENYDDAESANDNEGDLDEVMGEDSIQLFG